ncbi:MAG: DUF882 domain-containing protein [Pseudomonadota bacterium]
MSRNHPENSVNRRSFLRGGLAAFIAGGTAVAGADDSRRLALFGLHTHEFLDVEYFRDGAYVPGALSQIDHALRDHRENKSTHIDLALLNLLHALSTSLNTREPFRFLSGYRTQKTNDALRAAGRGVAKNSYHVHGRAIDILPPGVPLADLVFAAKMAQVGGVGQYTRRGFVHLDTGPVRHWVR